MEIESRVWKASIDARDKLGIWAHAHIIQKNGDVVRVSYDTYDSSFDEDMHLDRDATRIALRGQRVRNLDYPQQRYLLDQSVYAFRSMDVCRWELGHIRKIEQTVGRELVMVSFRRDGFRYWYVWEHGDIIDQGKADREMTKLYAQIPKRTDRIEGGVAMVNSRAAEEHEYDEEEDDSMPSLSTWSQDQRVLPVPHMDAGNTRANPYSLSYNRIAQIINSSAPSSTAISGTPASWTAAPSAWLGARLAGVSGNATSLSGPRTVLISPPSSRPVPVGASSNAQTSADAGQAAAQTAASPVVVVATPSTPSTPSTSSARPSSNHK